jgi:hypothetical protein
MHHTTFARALSLLTLAFLLLVTAGPVAAATLPTPMGVTPWSARCYTDTCVGLSVTFDSDHTAALGHPADDPDSWAIRDSTDLTADEESFVEATVSALARRDLPSLAAAYPALPAWYMDALATYVTAAPVDMTHRSFLPILRC